MNSFASPERRPYALSRARSTAARIPASRRMLPRSQPPVINNDIGHNDTSDDDDAGHGSGSIVLRAGPPLSPAQPSFARGYAPHTPATPAPSSLFA
ncbi:hypothetical protein OC844_001591, partial [Tilletia horrida]